MRSFGIARLQREVDEHPERFNIIDIPVDDIVTSPFNPKQRHELNEDNLSDILPSVRQFGVTSPALVCERAELVQNSPELDTVTAPGRYVMVAGHRRKAASKLANRSTIPATVRNEYATARALNQVLLFENLGRRGLSPLEAAEAYKRLADGGLSYQKIVETVGGAVRNKGQVSKAIKLLKLTPLGRDLLNQALITVDGAHSVLDKLADQPESQDRALTAATSGEETSRIPLSAAIEQESRRLEQEAATTALRERIQAEGLEEIDPQSLWGDERWRHRLDAADEIEAARAAGNLAGVVVVDARLQYYGTAVAPSGGQAEHPQPVEAEQVQSSKAADAPSAGQGFPKVGPETDRVERERRQAHRDSATARREACRRMVDEFTNLRDRRRQTLIEILADGVLAGGVNRAVLRRAEVAEWAGTPVGSSEDDLGEVITGNRTTAHRIALAAALAAFEAQAADTQYLGERQWPVHVQRYINRLVDLGYHTLTPYEHDKLAREDAGR